MPLKQLVRHVQRLRFTIFFSHMSVENTFENGYFAIVDDQLFWSDRERVKTLIDLYESQECLWNEHTISQLQAFAVQETCKGRY